MSGGVGRAAKSGGIKFDPTLPTVLELSLRNVGQVDYITSRWDYYYSFDINPLDGIKVREIKLNFYGHKLTSNTVRKQVGDLIPYLLDH